MPISQTTLLKRIPEGEGLFQEFKTSLEKVDRTMVAFANAKGGVIFLGLDDQGKEKPFSINNRSKAQIINIAQNIDPSLRIDIFPLKGNKLSALIVKEGDDKPYKCSDGFFLRIGASNQKLTRNEILDLSIKANRLPFESLQITEFQYPKDFSYKAFSNFVIEAQLGTTLKSMGREDFLISLGVAEKQKGKLIFNQTGILFFAKYPQRFLPQAKISYARYAGLDKSDVIDRKVFYGTLPEQLEVASNKLTADIPVTYQLLEGPKRKEIPSYPLRALEEALVNAVIHRDYSEIGAEILIEYYDNRITILNPGELLGSLSLEKLGNLSLRRNPIIGELFYRLGKGEKLGSGIQRMRSLTKEWKLKPPLFNVEEGFFSVTFEGPQLFISERKLKRLDKRPKLFVEARHQMPKIFKTSHYAEFFKITRRTAQNDIKELITQRVIQKYGKGKNTTYSFI